MTVKVKVTITDEDGTLLDVFHVIGNGERHVNELANAIPSLLEEKWEIETPDEED